ncbi:ferritin-like domain-containing protein [Roseibacillus ishigakijimensis]|uniref:Ferritin-like domain-containing protein n=1 Tax=Roseibacillus ishigakijimensis TaxID=454146 RepID=A0A934VLP0_9BACT|nr:ferritin-like domain-containing protein [Roseibacillus ishigakijimensis]MBK1833090.1 ferritin-like domain-containing protein [Roseibacillus ishigakijimensis]
MKETPLHEDIIAGLRHAYEMEIETVENYLAASVNLDGLRALSLRQILKDEVADELGHANKLASRIKALGGTVPGSMQMERSQRSLQPPSDSTDLVSVIKGVIDAESAAIDHYRRMIELTEGADPATQDLMIELLTDEEEHRREFAGFLKALQHEISRDEVPDTELVMSETLAA